MQKNSLLCLTFGLVALASTPLLADYRSHNEFQHPRYSVSLVMPLVSEPRRVEYAPRYRDSRTVDLLLQGDALDRYVFDGLRLVRRYGALPDYGAVDEFSIRSVVTRYGVTPSEAASWLLASREVRQSGYRDFVAVNYIEADLLKEASVLFFDIERFTSREEAVRAMPRYAAYMGYNRYIRREVVVAQPVVVRRPVAFWGINLWNSRDDHRRDDRKDIRKDERKDDRKDDHKNDHR